MKKFALIIGNNDYLYMNKLKYAVNDATAITDKLTKLGFVCKLVVNIDYASMATVFNEFEDNMKLYETCLVYFAGHGFEIDKTNYLAMTDTGIGIDGIPVKHLAYKLDDFINAFDNSDLRVKIIILDACRDGFSVNNRGNSLNGFAPIFAPKGTLIAYSTSPGQKAKENEKVGNGVYTSALLKCIDAPRVPIEGMFKKVREIVSATSSNSQIPWEHTSLLGDFYFNPDIANGNSIAIYSETALADAQYMFTKDSILKDIINDLKTCNYNIQNPAFTKLNRVNWNQASVNEIFILGRNIYQTSCGPSFAAQDYMDNLTSVVNRLPVDVADHLLTGMAYEIFFDKNGKLRNSFKDQYYEIIERLLSQRKGQALRFIQESLAKYDDRIIYMPGSEQKYIFAVSTEVYDNDSKVYKIVDICCNGQSVFYNEDGTEKYSSDEWYTQQQAKNEFEKKIASKIVAPKNMIEYVYDIGEKDFYIIAPSLFSLRWYGK